MKTMQCPTCKTEDLVLEQLEAGLSGQVCPQCAGAALALPAYSDWLAKRGSDSEVASAAPDFEVADSKRALCCPQCQRIMVKFKVAADAAHSLDYCFSCGEVWFDAGEWDYLKSRGLHTRVRSISTDPWQRRIREENAARVRAEGFKQAIGEEAFPVVENFRQWLSAHPGREDILRYLNTAE